MSQGYALKFISGKYQGGEFPLKDEKQIVIGRSSELDMVLVEDMVSRKHAKLTVGGGKITIEDLGSTNGTFVNGEKVKSSRVKEGDRILIGTSILKLVRQGADVPELDDAQVKLGDDDGDKAEQRVRPQRFEPLDHDRELAGGGHTRRPRPLVTLATSREMMSRSDSSASFSTSN